MNQIALTQNEMEIMDLLWEVNRPLSRAEIIELTPNRSWSKSSIHILLNSLLEKKAIEVTGFVRTNKNFGRIYSPKFSHDEYILTTLKGSLSSSSNPPAISSIFSALLQDKDIDDAILDNLQRMLDERRKQL